MKGRLTVHKTEFTHVLDQSSNRKEVQFCTTEVANTSTNKSFSQKI